MSEKKVPELRFKGFTEDWEQRKLTDVANYRNGKAHEQDIDKEGQYIVVNSKFVSTNGLVKKYSNVLIEPLQAGEIAFVLSDVPNGKAIARTFLINENNKYSLNQRIAGITPHTKADSYFLSILMNRNNYFLKYDNGVGQTNLSKHEVENFTEHYPVYEEQVKIGSFFKQVDDTIALHQDKLEKLKQLKKGYLQVMFPQNGETLPRLRFANFFQDWKQRKLGEVAYIIGGGTPSTKNNEFWNGDIDWYSPAEIGVQRYLNGSQKKITNLGLQKSSAKLLPVGTVLFTSRAGIGNTAILEKEGATNQGFQSIVPKKEKLDSYFIYSKTDELKKYGEITGAGSTFIEVSGKQMAKMPLLLPLINEQSKIATLFKELDNTITLQKEKIYALQELKNVYLQKIFV